MSSVSVVIPCYNGEAYLARALDSVRRQTRPADEVIVVDDGSTDRSPRIARDAGAAVIVTEMNGGPAAARNRGIREARGELIAFLDADDFWEPNHLAELVPLLEREDSVALAFSRERRLGDWEGEHPRVLPAGKPADAFWPLLRSNFIPQMGAVARRDVLLKLGGYREDMRYAEDYDLWLRLARRGPLICTEAVTCNHFAHAAQASRRDDLLARGAFEARHRVWSELRAGGSAADVARAEQIMRAAWQQYLRAAWRRRDPIGMAAALSLRDLVPGSEPLYRQWARKVRLFYPWYLRAGTLWDLLRGRRKSSAIESAKSA